MLGLRRPLEPHPRRLELRGPLPEGLPATTRIDPLTPQFVHFHGREEPLGIDLSAEGLVVLPAVWADIAGSPAVASPALNVPHLHASCVAVYRSSLSACQPVSHVCWVESQIPPDPDRLRPVPPVPPVVDSPRRDLEQP